MSVREYDGLELINAINETSRDLTTAVSYMKKAGLELADAEAAYKEALMKETLRLRDEGMPVTVIGNVVYGIVAESRRERDKAEAMYATSREHINVLKLQLKVLQQQAEMEWGQAKS